MQKIIQSFTEKHFKKITPARVTFLGAYLGIMLALKYLLGFVFGIELITFMFVIAALFLPLIDGMLLVVSFNFGIIALYGWGTWQIMYWFIWIFDFITTKLISKFTRNIYVFATWGFILGFLVAFWYFLSDLAFFGRSYAILNIISALPVNLIEGMTTSAMILMTGVGVAKIFQINSLRLWSNSNVFRFKKPKNKKMALFIVIIVSTIFVVGIIILFLYNQSFLTFKDSLLNHERAIKI